MGIMPPLFTSLICHIVATSIPIFQALSAPEVPLLRLQRPSLPCTYDKQAPLLRRHTENEYQDH